MTWTMAAYGDALIDYDIGRAGTPLTGTVVDDRGQAVPSGTDVTFRFRNRAGVQDSLVVPAGPDGRVSVDVPGALTANAFNFSVRNGGIESQEMAVMRYYTTGPLTLFSQDPVFVMERVDFPDESWRLIHTEFTTRYGEEHNGVFDVILENGLFISVKPPYFMRLYLVPGAIGYVDMNTSTFDFTLRSRRAEIFNDETMEGYTWDLGGAMAFSGDLSMTGPCEGFFIIPEPTTFLLLAFTGLVVMRRPR